MTPIIVRRAARHGAAALMFAALGACSSMGGLGNVLGGVLGGQQQSSSQASGIVQGVDSRSQQIAIQQSNGQAVWVRYDANTQVVYQNQTYSPTSLERGDQVTASVQDTGNGYYTNYVRVDQSVRGGGSVQSGAVQSFQGTVRQVDRSRGWFTVDDPNVGRMTVVLTNQVSRTDADRFNNLRVGEYVRLYGYQASNAQVQFRQFY
jgi:hypothetical protein